MKPADILQACVDDVLAGRRTPAECAAQHPEYPELLADLKAATLLQSARTVSLGAEADQRLQARMHQRAQTLRAANRQPRRTWASRWVVGPALAGALLVGGIGTAAAASTSNPGDPLYGVKRANENAELFFSPPSSRAFVYTNLAQHRLDELKAVLQRKKLDPAILERLSDDLTGETGQALSLVDETPDERRADLLYSLLQLTDEQQTVLSGAQALAPAEMKAALLRALQASGDGHTQANDRLQQVLASQKPNGSATKASILATARASGTQPVRPTRPAPLQTRQPPVQNRPPEVVKPTRPTP